MVPIHLGVGAVLKEILCFITGFHLAAVDTAVTRERGSPRRPDVDIGGVSNFSFRTVRVFRPGFYLTQIVAVFLVTLPTQGYKDH